jgi:hypothetical protein
MYTSPNIIEMRNTYNILIGKPGGKNYWEDLGVDGRVVTAFVHHF